MRTRRTPTTTGTLEIPGFGAASGETTLTTEDTMRLIITEHPEDFPEGLAGVGLTPKYEWERGSIHADDVAMATTVLLLLIAAVMLASLDIWWLAAIAAAPLTALCVVRASWWMRTIARRRRRRSRRGWITR